MFGRYSSIMTRTRPQYADIIPMTREARAAQFSPFAALTGYGDAVDEEARLTDSRPDLTEDEAAGLDAEMNRLLDDISCCPEVRLTCFIPDKSKSGGSFAVKEGAVRTYDSYSQALVFTDGTRIASDLVIKILRKDQPSAEDAGQH